MRTVLEESESVSFSVLELASPTNRVLICASAIDQNADIGPNAIGQVAHGDLLIGAVKPCEVRLSDSKRIESIGIISDLTVVLAVRSRDHQARHRDNVTMDFA